MIFWLCGFGFEPNVNLGIVTIFKNVEIQFTPIFIKNTQIRLVPHETIKRLQIEFTCAKIPFRPARNSLEEQVCRFLNEIVLEEESDELGEGFISHFAFYCKAFEEILDEDSKSDFENVFQFYEQVIKAECSYGECK